MPGVTDIWEPTDITPAPDAPEAPIWYSAEAAAAWQHGWARGWEDAAAERAATEHDGRADDPEWVRLREQADIADAEYDLHG